MRITLSGRCPIYNFTRLHLLTMLYSVHYEMPQSKHIHKSMLLRGVELGKPVLNQSDIEMTKSRAARSGRSHGGVPLSGDGRGRNSVNYSSGNKNHYPPRNNPYQPQNNYNNPFPIPPPNWQPPPPGVGAFARGPPPPPPGSYGGYPAYPPPPPQYGYGQATNDRRPRGNGDGYRGNYNNYGNRR
jgi:5'-3' exoribonuclease 2